MYKLWINIFYYIRWQPVYFRDIVILYIYIFFWKHDYSTMLLLVILCQFHLSSSECNYCSYKALHPLKKLYSVGKTFEKVNSSLVYLLSYFYEITIFEKSVRKVFKSYSHGHSVCYWSLSRKFSIKTFRFWLILMCSALVRITIIKKLIESQ